MKIGISISESAELEFLGYSQIHLQDAMVEIARYLLVSEYNLVYGGDVRYSSGFNFAQLLFDFVDNYNKKTNKKERITNYVCYPLCKNLSNDLRTNYMNKCVFKELEAPKDVDLKGENWDITLKGETLHSKYIWAYSLTEMRKQMNADVDGRIFIGGKSQSYKGKYPGLIEEAYYALVSKKPIYLIGAYGGCTKVIIEAILGKEPEELTPEFQYAEKGRDEFVNYYNSNLLSQDDKIDFSEIVKYFNQIGLNSLNNGLSDKENEKLFFSNNVSEIISLILKGLKAATIKSTN